MNSTDWEYISSLEKDTIGLGYRLGGVLVKGDIIALIGELGSGKTCLARGIAYGLGLPDGTVITSPSFSLANEYRGRHPLVHMDLYRLEGPEESFSLGLEEYFDGEYVVVVEWAERCPELLPPDKLMVRLYIQDEHTRLIRFSGQGLRAAELINTISTGG